jgi:hypothetical protein
MLIFGALLIAGSAYAYPGVQDHMVQESVYREVCVLNVPSAEVLVAVRMEPLVGYHVEALRVVRVDAPGALLLVESVEDGQPMPMPAHTSGGMPG